MTRSPVTRPRTTTRRPVRLAGVVLALAGVLALTGCKADVYSLPLPGGPDVGDDPITLTVQFEDVLDLVPKSTVKVNDVTVGEVTDVELGEYDDERDLYPADVTVELRDDVDLPENATATIRQTSLLGEKFVSLAAPAEDASSEPLESGDVIPLDRTGRNPEVEEVLGALSLVLNGGGVAQLKTITVELNNALEGREDTTRSLLGQVDLLMGQLSENKQDIVDAIESLNGLAKAARGQQTSIDAALEELPSALDSIDRQRGDLVKMLRSLDRLSDVGVRVIQSTKENTIETVRQLQPVLTEFSNAGDSFVDAFNVFLTYPFVDEVVGRDPQVARSVQPGDYTNLSIELDIDLTDLPELPGLPCNGLDQLPQNPGESLEDLLDVPNLCEGAQNAITECLSDPTDLNCLVNLPGELLDTVCESVGSLLGGNQCDGLLGGGGGGGNGSGGDGGGGLGGLLDGLPGLGLGDLGLNRPAPSTGGGTTASGTTTMDDLMDDYDAGLVNSLVGPLAVQP